MVNEILERNLPVLNFAAYHLPKPWAEWFVACAAGGSVWLKFWRGRRDPKKGVGTRRYFSRLRRSLRHRRQISLDWYTIPPPTQAKRFAHVNGRQQNKKGWVGESRRHT